MATIIERGEFYTGATAESIARRIWGRKAEVLRSPDPNCKWGKEIEALIVRQDKYGTHVLARVVVRDDAE